MKPLAIHSRMTEMPLGIYKERDEQEVDGLCTPMMSRKTIRSAGGVVEPPADRTGAREERPCDDGARTAAMTIAVRKRLDDKAAFDLRRPRQVST